jgi:cell division protein FtsL
MEAGIIGVIVVISLFVAMGLWKIERRIEVLEHKVNAQKHEIELLLSQTTKRKE